MKLKIGSYNISGGFYEDNQSIDFFDKEKSNDIDLRLLNDTVKIINDEDIDIICLQEIITTERIYYINRIMEKTNLKYEEHFELSPCHIIENTECGIAILSKYPIDNSIKKFFTNPMLSKTTSSGKTYYTFDKGLLISKININNNYINVLTQHGFPFRRFNSTPEDNINTFIEFDNYVKEYNPDIITGDFNSENFLNMMTYTKENYIKTISEITTDDGMKFDNILLKNNNKYSKKIIKSLSDHFIVINEIEF
ncbi:MAG: endonuclease/exonuclease/phosphatase family protein [Clostridia bacterium]|nr:endonuclease/exonuclease/phosphatase family protein [Clostridia bacterium]